MKAYVEQRKVFCMQRLFDLILVGYAVVALVLPLVLVALLIKLCILHKGEWALSDLA